MINAGLAAAGTALAGHVSIPEWIAQATSTIASLIVATILFGLVYKVVPDVDLEWRDVARGAFITSLLFNTGKFLVGIYLGKASFASAYGAAGSLVVCLFWVYYSALIFFLGAKFTQVSRTGTARHPPCGSGACCWVACTTATPCHSRPVSRTPKDGITTPHRTPVPS